MIVKCRWQNKHISLSISRFKKVLSIPYGNKTNPCWICIREILGSCMTNRFLSLLWLRLLSRSRLLFRSLFLSRDSSLSSDSPWECFFLLQPNDSQYGILFLLAIYGFWLLISSIERCACDLVLVILWPQTEDLSTNSDTSLQRKK